MGGYEFRETYFDDVDINLMNFILLDDFRDLHISIGVCGLEIYPIHHKNNVHCRWTKLA